MMVLAAAFGNCTVHRHAQIYQGENAEKCSKNSLKMWHFKGLAVAQEEEQLFDVRLLGSYVEVSLGKTLNPT